MWQSGLCVLQVWWQMSTISPSPINYFILIENRLGTNTSLLMLQPDGPKFMSMKISKTAPAQHYNHSLRLMNFWQFQVNCNTCNSHYMTKINVSLCHFYKKHLPWGPKVVSYKHPICCKINQHCKKNIRREKKRMNTAIILLKNKYGCPIWNTFIS